MKKKLSVFISALLVICTVFSIAILPANAANYKNKVKVASKSALLVDLETGQTVYEKGADKKRYPASTTKIMTYIIVAENVNNFKRAEVLVKQAVLDKLNGTGSSMANVGSHVGKKMSVLDLLYSMMVPSGNDAAMVLADYIGGNTLASKGKSRDNIDSNIRQFVSMMNAKAKKLGCKNTHFMNPDGLHDEKHYTTARDLSKMALYALDLPEFSKITNTTTYFIQGEDYPLITTNYLIDANRGGNYYYQYAQGIKTGTTDEAGHCLVTVGKADGNSYLGVFLKSPYNPDPTKDVYGTMIDAKELFRWSLTQLALNQVASAETPMREVKLNLAWGKNSVQLVPEKNINAIVPKSYKDSDIKIETKAPEEGIDAPVKKGDVVGKAVVYYDGEEVDKKTKLAEVNLVSSETVERSEILFYWSVITKFVSSIWFKIVLGVIVFLLIIYIIISTISKRRSRKRRRNIRRYRNF